MKRRFRYNQVYSRRGGFSLPYEDRFRVKIYLIYDLLDKVTLLLRNFDLEIGRGQFRNFDKPEKTDIRMKELPWCSIVTEPVEEKVVSSVIIQKRGI